MDQDKRRNILIISLLILALLMVGFIVWWQFFREQGEEVVVNTNTVTNANVDTPVVDVTNTAIVDTNTNSEVIIEEDLTPLRLASIFAERFGSYNSISDYQNTKDLKIYMTDTMQSWADNFITTQSAIETDGAYFAVVTKTINTRITSDGADNKTLEVLTQRTESGDNLEVDNTYIQTIELEMVRENDVWLVNTATWGEKQ